MPKATKPLTVEESKSDDDVLVKLQSSEDIDNFAVNSYNKRPVRHVVDLAANHNSLRATRQKTEVAYDDGNEDPIDIWDDKYTTESSSDSSDSDDYFDEF